MINAAPPGPYASYWAPSYATPGSSPVPRRIARLMLSAGMLFCLASAMIVRSRGFMSGSPPPARAATVNSLIRRVKTLPRLASAAPFLCLMECHLEWPDMNGSSQKILHLFREDDPHIGACVPRSAAIVPKHAVHAKTRGFEPLDHPGDGNRSEGQLEPVLLRAAVAALDVTLLEGRQQAAAILAN